jgi:hypothetical protein
VITGASAAARTRAPRLPRARYWSSSEPAPASWACRSLAWAWDPHLRKNSQAETLIGCGRPSDAAGFARHPGPRRRRVSGRARCSQPACSVWSSAAGSARAIAIAHADSLGGDAYRYTYSVSNDGSLGSGVALDSSASLFDPRAYDESSPTVSSPAALATLGPDLLECPRPASRPPTTHRHSGGIADGSTAGSPWTSTGSAPVPGIQPFQTHDPASLICSKRWLHHPARCSGSCDGTLGTLLGVRSRLSPALRRPPRRLVRDEA